MEQCHSSYVIQVNRIRGQDRVKQAFMQGLRHSAKKLIQAVALGAMLLASHVPFQEAKADEGTRLKRPTVLYGSAQHRKSISGATKEAKDPGLLKGQGSMGEINTLFPTSAVKTPPIPLSARKENSIQRPLTGNLSNLELNILSERELIVLVDKSYSMKTRDCPPVIGAILVKDRAPGLMHELFGDKSSISRWQWVAAHALDFANQVSPVKPEGFRLILFNQWRDIHDRVAPAQVPKIFYNTKVGGDTLLAQFLGEQLLQYIEKRKAATDKSKVKPLAIAVVTDGLPDDKNNLSEIIIHTTKNISSKDDVSITFLQVGKSSKGGEFLAGLDNNLKAQGARFDIVDHKTFNQVKVSGLGRAIVDAVLEK